MQMQRQKLSGRRLAAFALVVVFILGPGWSNAATPEVINIAWTGEYWSTLPFRVAADKGFFERENLQARFINFQSTQLITNALMQGDLDVCNDIGYRWGCTSRTSAENRWRRSERHRLRHRLEAGNRKYKGLEGEKVCSKLIRQRTRLARFTHFSARMD